MLQGSGAGADPQVPGVGNGDGYGRAPCRPTFMLYLFQNNDLLWMDYHQKLVDQALLTMDT